MRLEKRENAMCKKVLLVIVEGETDETALKSSLENIFEDKETYVYVVGGDITSNWDVPDDEYYNEIYEGITKSNIGGYPDFVQDDSGDYNSQKDICILKLDDMSHDDIYIGDSGILRVIVPKEDLKNKIFDNAYLDWDCC